MRDPLVRFINKIRVDESGCWVWGAATDPTGYARFADGGKLWRAHRWAYERFVGPIPEGLDLDHLCRVRNCVNPEHLEAVTRRVNLLRAHVIGKTHCPQGHSYEGGYIDPRGSRRCRECHRIRSRIRRQLTKESK